MVKRVLRIEKLEERWFFAADFAWDVYEFRSLDGSGNNLEHPDWGSAGSELLRMAAADYLDGTGEMIIEVQDRENPRVVSNIIASQGTDEIPNDRALSDFVWQWGQFLDHDISLTQADPTYGTADIPMPEGGDAQFGKYAIPFSRSIYDQQTADNPRQQINQITSYIDASNVYGSDQTRADALRTFAGGQLKLSEGALLPFNDPNHPLPNAGEPASAPLFVAGDIRANEQVGLTSMHTLFVREHNRLADRIAKLDPRATDEQIYQLARKIVGAEMQIITYEEFLPALLGIPSLPGDTGYDVTVNATIANEFSSALYRFGHSMLSPNLLLVDQRQTIDQLPLQDAFFNVDFLQGDAQNVDRVLRGLARQRAQEIDTKVVDDVRNFLFGAPGHGGMDLASMNIQRGRDHGLPDYNTLREAYGLDRVSTFGEITSRPELQSALQELYGSVDNIDPWVGALAEDHVRGASVGSLTHAALVHQFQRLRSGDRFFYLYDSSLFEKDIAKVIKLKGLTLSEIIKRNTNVTDLPKDVFHVRGNSQPPSKASVALACLAAKPKQDSDIARSRNLLLDEPIEQLASNDSPPPALNTFSLELKNRLRSRVKNTESVFADELLDDKETIREKIAEIWERYDGFSSSNM